MVAMHAVKLLTFQPMINPVLRCLEHKCAGHSVFEIAAEEFMISIITGGFYGSQYFVL